MSTDALLAMVSPVMAGRVSILSESPTRRDTAADTRLTSP